MASFMCSKYKASDSVIWRAVCWWQSQPTSHPLTCLDCNIPERDAFPLLPALLPGKTKEFVGLKCHICGYTQEYIPAEVVTAYTEAVNQSFHPVPRGPIQHPKPLVQLDGFGADGYEI